MIVVALVWVLGQGVFALDVATAATVAALGAGVVGGPLAAWASSEVPHRLAGPDGGARALPPAGPLPSPPRRAWNIPARNAAFTGRDSLLTGLRARMRAGGPVAVLALHGMGGVGKTSLAVEYAHRYGRDYPIAWWINSERPDLIPEQLAALGVATGWVTAALDADLAAREVLWKLREVDHWLIVFDNVDDPDDVLRWLPSQPGHTLITSRNPNWRQVAAAHDIDVFSRAESVALLRNLVPSMDDGDADLVADSVGDLPLALAQAGGVIAGTGMPAADYIDELRQHAELVMTRGRPTSYQTTLAATVRISLERLGQEDLAAVQLLRLSALLAPEVVPVEIFTVQDADLPEPLASRARSGFELRTALGRVGRYGLAKVDTRGLQIHRLTQSIVVDLLDSDDRSGLRSRVERLLALAAPPNWHDPAHWPRWAALLPHVLAVDPTRTDDAGLRGAALDAAAYLRARGDAAAGHRLAESLFQRWRDRLGPDAPDTLRAAHTYAIALASVRRYAEAKALCEDTLPRQKRLLGPTHRHTLNTVNNIALYLYETGDPEQALVMHADTWRHLRESFGDDDGLTLGVAHNLALDLGAVGRHDEALALHRDTYQRRARVLGVDHPHTLLSAADLAHELFRARQADDALALLRDALGRALLPLGRDHPTTLRLANDTADVLHAIGRSDEAVALHTDTLRRRQRLHGPEHPETRRSERALSTALRATGGVPAPRPAET